MNVNDYIQICVMVYSTKDVIIRNINKEWLNSVYAGDINLYIEKHLKCNMDDICWMIPHYIDIQI